MSEESTVRIYNDVVDKSSWPRGEWDHEPDKLQWKDKSTGYPCIIVRGPVGGLCGYVAVPPSHPLYRKHYTEVRELGIGHGVHGGVTFSDTCADGGNESENICHIPEPGDSDDVWWFGFDCGHGFDITPKFPMLSTVGRKYRNLAYVKQSVAALVANLEAAEHGHV